LLNINGNRSLAKSNGLSGGINFSMSGSRTYIPVFIVSEKLHPNQAFQENAQFYRFYQL